MRRSAHLRRLAAFIISAEVLAFSFAGEGSAEPFGPAQREQGTNDLAVLIETAQRAWAYAEDKQEHFGVDFSRLRDQGGAAIAESQNQRDVLLALRDVVAGFNDGHASLTHPGLRRAGPLRKLPLPLVDTKEGIVHATNLIVLWKGRPIEEAIQAEARHVFASTPGMRRSLALRRLENGATNEVAPVTLRQASGRTFESVLEYSALPAEAPAPIEFHWLTNHVACIRIATFKPDVLSESTDEAGAKDPSGHSVSILEAAKARIAAAFSNAAPARCLILDLRGNQGGTDILGSFVALHLVPGEFTYFKLQTRHSPELRTVPGFSAAATEGWAPVSEWKPPRPEGLKPFAEFVVVLQDSLCFSTTDNLLACLRDLLPPARATFIGRPSGGGTGAPRPVARLPHSQAAVTLTVMKVFSPKGRLIEGRGTIPDRQINYAWSDIVKGRDADLEAALEEARQHMSRTGDPGEQKL
jgi:C-terminal processing protease CtpA/Prc